MSNTPFTIVNAIVIKKDKKIDVDLNQVKYYNYYKKRHHTNKYLKKLVLVLAIFMLIIVISMEIFLEMAI